MIKTRAEIQNQARELIADYLRINPEELQPETHIVDDLGADSLAVVELGFRLSETFGIPVVNTSDADLLVFDNLIDYIEANVRIEMRREA